MLFTNYKDYSKAVSNVLKFDKYILDLFDKIFKDKEYYKEEIKYSDYDDDALEAIVKGCFDKTELELIEIYLRYRVTIHYINKNLYYNCNYKYNGAMDFFKYYFLGVIEAKPHFKYLTPRQISYRKYRDYKDDWRKRDDDWEILFDKCCIALNKFQLTELGGADDEPDEPEETE